LGTTEHELKGTGDRFWDHGIEAPVKSPVETLAVQPPVCEEPPPESPIETPEVAPLAASAALGPVLDPALDPVLDPVVLDPVLDPVALDPALDPVALDPVSDPRPPVPPDPVDLRSPASVLDPVLDPVPPDIPSAGPVPELRGSPVFGPATVIQFASPVETSG
jgi:hypothetical protein